MLKEFPFSECVLSGFNIVSHNEMNLKISAKLYYTIRIYTDEHYLYFSVLGSGPIFSTVVLHLHLTRHWWPYHPNHLDSELFSI